MILCTAVRATYGLDLSEAQLSHLSSHPTWLRLLHIPLNTQGATHHHSEVNSDEFYVSEDRFATARDELTSTIAALDRWQDQRVLDLSTIAPAASVSSHRLTAPKATQSFALNPAASSAKADNLAAASFFAAIPTSVDSTVSDPNNSVQCRFPARAFWLSYQLKQPGWRDFSLCSNLNRWAKFDTFESMSLIMISGYFGNPASTFGHSLLRLNNNSLGEESTLLDLGINFGAQVPPGEPTLLYILRGLFGGYQSGFSDRTFYEHDQTYNRVEFRDRWEYRLNLSDDQQTLLALHLWEIAGKKFTYYFIHQNCSYRLAELLELATGNELTEQVRLWYAPVTLFHDLRRIKHQSGSAPFTESKNSASTPITAASQKDGSALFTEVQYVASIEQQLRERMAALSVTEHSALLKIIKEENDLVHTNLEVVSKQRVLSTALDYFEYKLASLGEPATIEPDDQAVDSGNARETREEKTRFVLNSLKENVLRQRLQLPVLEESAPSPSYRAAPSELDPPSVLNWGYGYNENQGGYLSLNYAAYQHKAIGQNTYQQSALVVFDATLAVDDEKGFFIDTLDFIRARKTNAPNYFLPGENRRSWEVALGLESTRRFCSRCIESFAEGSVGRAKRFGNNWLAEAGMGGRLSSKDSAIELIPKARAIYYPSQAFSTELQVSWWYSPTRGRDHSKMRYQLDSRYSLGNNRQITVSFDQYHGFAGHVSFGWRW